MLSVGQTVCQIPDGTKPPREGYTGAPLKHRDPEAAVRKARYITKAMSEGFGADQADTVKDVARFLVLHGRRLCGGGLR